MTSGNVSDMHDVAIGSEGHDQEPLNRRDSHDNTSISVPSIVFNSQNGYTPLEDAEDQHIQEGKTSTYDTMSDRSSRSNQKFYYNHSQSRKFLLWTGLNRLLITLLLCIFIGLTLRGFEGFDSANRRILSKSQTKTFNAVMLGLSLGLGLNIASSLKHYGLILRWSILTQRWVPLQVFDLILGCENLIKVFQLMVISFPWVDRLPDMSIFPWLKPRKDTTKWTWIICLVWLLVNAGAQVLVATLSIFWPIDPSGSIPLLTRGDILVSDLGTWRRGYQPMSPQQLFAANVYGYAGTPYPTITTEDYPDYDPSVEDGQVIFFEDGHFKYTFLNRDPLSRSNYAPSSRSVRSIASCQQFTFGAEAGNCIDMLVEGSLDGGQTFARYPVLHYVPGQISWTAFPNQPCGPRCTKVLAYQRQDNRTITQNAMFMCNSTIEPITSSNPNEFTNLNETQKVSISSTDEFARVAAGAIGWSGYFENRTRDYQTQVYMSGLKFSPYEVMVPPRVAWTLSRFAIGAIAAFDNTGDRITIPDQSIRPVQGQILNPDWSRILIILGWILFIQLCALIALLALANKSIIRDESFFSLAMLLSPVIDKLNKEECMNLSGEQIFEQPILDGRRIRYDYVKVGRGRRKVHIAFEDEQNEKDENIKQLGLRKGRRAWPDSEYI